MDKISLQLARSETYADKSPETYQKTARVSNIGCHRKAPQGSRGIFLLRWENRPEGVDTSDQSLHIIMAREPLQNFDALRLDIDATRVTFDRVILSGKTQL